MRPSAGPLLDAWPRDAWPWPSRNCIRSIIANIKSRDVCLGHWWLSCIQTIFSCCMGVGETSAGTCHITWEFSRGITSTTTKNYELTFHLYHCKTPPPVTLHYQRPRPSPCPKIGNLQKRIDNGEVRTHESEDTA
jgi:hypothetical protein